MKSFTKYIFVVLILLSLLTESVAVYNPHITNVYFTPVDVTSKYNVYLSPLNTNNFQKVIGAQPRPDSNGIISISVLVSDDRIWYISIRVVDTNGNPVGDASIPIRILPRAGADLTPPTNLVVVEIK